MRALLIAPMCLAALALGALYLLALGLERLGRGLTQLTDAGIGGLVRLGRWVEK